MKVAFLASEAAPYAKTGGLADVAGALPKYLEKLGLEVRVFLPFYRQVKRKNLSLQRILDHQDIEWKAKKEQFSVWETREGSLVTYFIEKDEYYDRDYLYGTPQGDYADNGERFAFFSKAMLVTLEAMNFAPDVIHCHDWQTAMALAYLRFIYRDEPFFQNARSLFTIHNLAYQGLFKKEILSKIGLPDELFNMEDLEFFGKVNFLKVGILYSTAINTVSPRYSQEIQTSEYGHGLDGLLQKRSAVLSGILNGVDYSEWDPSLDVNIAARYGPDDLKGKSRCKNDLLDTFHLPSSTQKGTPILGMVSRLAGQKGLDILCDALEDIFKLDIYLVILGTGEEKIQNILKLAHKRHSSRFGLKIAFDEALAHKVMAGSDLFLLPSRYEPCGLTQMYSLKYGTIPVARATGGLDDTIQEFDMKSRSGNGFKFQEYNSSALGHAVQRALSVYSQESVWQKIRQNAMASDFSWKRSTQQYIDLYRRIVCQSSSPNSA